MIRGARLVAVVGWPAFLAACVLEMAVFAWVDPHALHGAGAALPASAVYSLAFVLFWGVAAGAIVMALRLACTPQEINEADGS